MLARELYVSRTAVSKWESGKGYPSIDTLKQLASFFSVTVDELICTESVNHTDESLRSHRIFPLLLCISDLLTPLLMLLPLFASRTPHGALSVSLFASSLQPYLKALLLVLILCTALLGIGNAILRLLRKERWQNKGALICTLLSLITFTLLVLSSQPYAAIFAFILLSVRSLALFKGR